jgi:Zn-finger nucleic acid-binding protein
MLPMKPELLGDGRRVVDRAGPYRSVDAPTRQVPRQREIDRCPECGGVFFDAGEFAQGLREAAAIEGSQTAKTTSPAFAAPRVLSVGEIECPRCAGAMAQLQSQLVPNLVYDRCERCAGLFFDKGELTPFAGAGVAACLLASGEFEQASSAAERRPHSSPRRP